MTFNEKSLRKTSSSPNVLEDLEEELQQSYKLPQQFNKNIKEPISILVKSPKLYNAMKEKSSERRYLDNKTYFTCIQYQLNFSLLEEIPLSPLNHLPTHQKHRATGCLKLICQEGDFHR